MAIFRVERNKGYPQLALYQQERGGEHRLYVDEYIRRKGFLLGQ